MECDVIAGGAGAEGSPLPAESETTSDVFTGTIVVVTVVVIAILSVLLCKTISADSVRVCLCACV